MARQNKVFQQELDAHCEMFIAGESFGETNQQVLEAFKEFILERERIRHQVANGTEKARELDRQTLQKMLIWDTDNPDHLLAEKVFRRLAQEDEKGALSLIRNVEDKIRKRSEEMRRRASVPREPHPINELIREIVEEDPDISEKELIQKLEAQAGGDVIATMTEKIIEPYDTDYGYRKVSGLRSSLSRIKGEILRS